MPKQVVLVMDKHYPFGECQQLTTQVTKVLVRQKIPINLSNRQSIISKGNFLRKLNNDHMVRIQSILEQEDTFHFLFEYVPIKIQTWISNINEQFIEGFRDQIVKLSNYLANNYIITTFSLSNIGMDQNYNAKYFLSLDIQVDKSINRQKLKSTYIRDIYNLFKPYVTKNKDEGLKQSLKYKKGYNETQQEDRKVISNSEESYHNNHNGLLSPHKQLKKSCERLQVLQISPKNDKYNRLLNITDRLNEIKSNLSLFQANKKNEDAIQIIQAQMKKNSDECKINNILDSITPQNKNDMSDHIIKQFMDVLGDQDKNQDQILSQIPNFYKVSNGEQQSNNLHKRVFQAINHSMRVINKFKNTSKI